MEGARCGLWLFLNIWSPFFWLSTYPPMPALRIAAVVQYCLPTISTIMVNRNPQPAHRWSIVRR
ncbi:hypothetical protein L207DRAFT_521353 [Hyaloscypha variabilis F]|uniref:Uncharacterized protein n=1 Tax=Hyaloscypha variabilis (strain UAMH 11265 / GT02V1 / F) TaxID=1149755 RepID=A0A2J6QRE4_HYAVF|nr:hypothetical protein L207DRAFT_521353 [Hyaloscypha variabilis F]